MFLFRPAQSLLLNKDLNNRHPGACHRDPSRGRVHDCGLRHEPVLLAERSARQAPWVPWTRHGMTAVFLFRPAQSLLLNKDLNNRHPGARHRDPSRGRVRDCGLRLGPVLLAERSAPQAPWVPWTSHGMTAVFSFRPAQSLLLNKDLNNRHPGACHRDPSRGRVHDCGLRHRPGAACRTLCASGAMGPVDAPREDGCVSLPACTEPAAE